jgi:hypothetical protein
MRCCADAFFMVDLHPASQGRSPAPMLRAQWVRLLVLIVCLVWASAAAVPFISKTVVDRWVPPLV